MKEGVNGKNLNGIVFLKARVVRRSLFNVSTPKEMKDMSVSQPRVGRAAH